MENGLPFMHAHSAYDLADIMLGVGIIRLEDKVPFLSFFFSFFLFFFSGLQIDIFSNR